MWCLRCCLTAAGFLFTTVQVIQLPRNSISLYGNLSTDDHDSLSYEWSLSPESKDKVVEMQVKWGKTELFTYYWSYCSWVSKQCLTVATVCACQGVRTPILQLSAMQEGDYTFQLTVTDSAGQQDTAQVTVIVQPGNNFWLLLALLSLVLIPGWLASSFRLCVLSQYSMLSLPSGALCTNTHVEYGHLQRFYCLTFYIVWVI